MRRAEEAGARRGAAARRAAGVAAMDHTLPHRTCPGHCPRGTGGKSGGEEWKRAARRESGRREASELRARARRAERRAPATPSPHPHASVVRVRAPCGGAAWTFGGLKG